MNDTEPNREASKPASSGRGERHDADQQDLSERERADGRPDGGDSADRRADDIEQVREIGGRKGPDPVRYGDWEKNGRCIDF